MPASHAELVVLTVDGHVLSLAGRELLHSGLNSLHAVLTTGVDGRDVGVETSTVPVTRDGLGRKGNLDTKLLSNAVEKEARHPELVTEGNAGAGANLVLPLGGHNLGIGARDVDLGVHAGLVVGLDDVTAKDLASTNTTVVRTLGGGEAVLGPAIWPAKFVKKGVLLLETEPEVGLLVLLKDYGSIVAEVVRVGRAIGHVSLAHDKDVVSPTEGIGEVCNRAEVDIGVLSGRLTS